MSAAPTRMRSIAAAAASVLLVMTLVACASREPVPEWQSNAKSGLERAIAAYFVGNARVEAQEFATARAVIASTGRPVLVARAELVRCASRLASLVIEPCSRYDALAQDAEPAERAYAAFLAGRAGPADGAQLPEQHRALVVAGATPASDLAALERSVDPFSRLVGAAVRFDLGVGADRTAADRGRHRPVRQLSDASRSRPATWPLH